MGKSQNVGTKIAFTPFFNGLETKNRNEKRIFFSNSLGMKNKLLIKFKDINKTFSIV